MAAKIPVFIEAVGVKSEYLQDGCSVCFCYDYWVDARLQIRVVRSIFSVIGCVCYKEREYT